MKDIDRPAWNLIADLQGAPALEQPEIIRRAFEWQREAERRRITKAIRDRGPEWLTKAEAVACVRAPRKRGGGR